MSTPGNEQQVVFLLSIMPRSGTNYLARLLALHPACARSVIDEDGLLARSHNLVRFVRQQDQVWQGNGDDPRLPSLVPAERMLRQFGAGMKAFLAEMQDAAGEPRPAWLVAKTPRITNLENFARLFPTDRLIVLLRDGQAVVESLDTSFGYGFEQATRDWAAAARHFLDRRPTLRGEQLLVLRYEELVSDTPVAMDKVLRFLGLDPAQFDRAAAEAMPVFGSSELARDGGQVDWQPRAKADGFDPLARAQGWDEQRRSRFEWLAGKEWHALGYGQGVKAPARPLWNRWCDFAWQVRRVGSIFASLPQLARRARRILAEPV